MAIVQSIVAGLLGALILDRLRVPAGALIGAMLGAAVLNLSGAQALPVSPWLRFGAFAVIGWVLGQQLTRGSLATIRSALLPVGVIVVSLLLAGAVVAISLRLAGMDPATAYLAASPGGISQMAALSADLGANGPLVVAAHLARVIAIIVTAPLVVRILGG